jgi:hypothetical protein
MFAFMLGKEANQALAKVVLLQLSLALRRVPTPVLVEL